MTQDRSVPPRTDLTPLSFRLDELAHLPVDERIRVLARTQAENDASLSREIRKLREFLHDEFARSRRTAWQLAGLVFSICFVAGTSALILIGEYKAKVDAHDAQILQLERERGR